MIREQVTVEDFNRISEENEYYLWHFVKKIYTGPLEIQPYFDDKTEKYKLKTILDMVDIPFFESYTEDSVDFLINLDIMGSGEEGITVVNATNYPNEFDRLTKINDENKLLTQIKKRGPAKNSDHYWFTTKNVPSFFIYTQGLNKNYHDVFDTYENLSFIEYKDIITLLVKFVESF